jgi:hypothetical protein
LQWKDTPADRDMFQQLDEFARPAVLMFILFLVFTYVALNIPGFTVVVFKGAILAILVLPLVFTTNLKV